MTKNRISDLFAIAMHCCQAYALLVLCAATAIASSPQTFTKLYSFCSQSGCTDGAEPTGGLIQAIDGNLYGTTYEGGVNSAGTVFKISPSGKLKTLYSFCSVGVCTDGAGPQAGLVQATDGNFYGTTAGGGANVYFGTVFKITPSGKLTTLHSFDGTDGAYPLAALVQAADGNLYGTTYDGGSHRSGSCGSVGCGTVFKITPSGKLTTLHSFDYKDGDAPYATLIQANDGNFYGMTFAGGADDNGTVFKITPSGRLTTLHSFDVTDGGDPIDAALVQAANGNLYGTTELGTVFEITLSGKLTTLLTFNGADGELPEAGLIQATDGKLYGTTGAGGTNATGTVFKITTSGKLTTLHNFCRVGCEGGASPYFGDGVVQDTNGEFYGETLYGGGNDGCNSGYGCGTVYRLSVGLGPFVETQPTSGKAGTAVKILGTDLTGATSVTFNGTAAVFKVVSASLITTTVPTGATTGTVEVTTPKGTLKSSVVFRVTK